MGLFKKLGNAIKKGVKQISLKNVVKLGTPLLSAIPVVGGLAQSVVSNISASHEAKKQEEAAIKAGNEQQAEYYRQLAEQQALLAGAQVGQQGGSVIKTFTKGATDELIAQTSASTKKVAGDIGAELTDQTIKSWFGLHWKHLLIGLGVIGGVLFFRKSGNNNKRKPQNRRN